MGRSLIFELFSPLVSWGDIAVGERRPSFAHPSKSAVLGIVAGSLGYGRQNDSLHEELHNRFALGVRVDDPGKILLDYQTVQWASAAALRGARKRRPVFTRADLLQRVELGTILSARQYRSDALAVAALFEKRIGEPSLEAVKAALERPHYAPYLGRRCSSPALPFHPTIVEVHDPLEALRGYEPTAQYREILAHISGSGGSRRTYLWEGEGGDTVITRRDGLLSRSRWQFTERAVQRKDEEVSDVSVPD